MEKKGGRTVQASAKGLAGSESKKNQDGANGKPWPRQARRRESATGSPAFRSEASRKPNPQRTKAIDKRPKPRGCYYGGGPAPFGGKEEAGLAEDAEAELGSVYVPGGKKQSLNHLLNFHLAPREGRGAVVASKSGSGSRWSAASRHKYNKEHFLQANCQFIVNSNGDYRSYLCNPDALVDWNLIEQVNLQVLDFPACPICLYQPVAAKITRCGHIYCWSCMLHYLSLSDKSSRKCPICFEDVHKKDLKSVVPVPHSAFNVNGEITFRLMKRARGSLIAHFADVAVSDHDRLYSVSEIDSVRGGIHSKLLVADGAEIMTLVIQREKLELGRQLIEDDDCPEKCFIEEAIGLLGKREEDVLSRLDTLEEERRGISDAVELLTLDNPNAQQTPPVKYYYFYQAHDGQHIYLHPLNVRMLEFAYGSLEASPLIIKGRIVEKEDGSVTEDLRKRLRYMQHLPLTCQFEFAEIQLKEPLVSRETLEHFHDQLENRKKKRQRKAREEKRRERRIVEEENKKMGKFPRAADLHLESHNHFPEFAESHDQFPDFGLEFSDGQQQHRQRSESESTNRSDCAHSPHSTHSNSLAGSLSNDYAGMSFAKMLASAKTPPTWPQKKTVASAPIGAPKNDEGSEPECEYYVPAPAFNQSFGDAIAIALEKAAAQNFAPETEDEPRVVGKKKKKKNKQKVLFATGMNFGGNQ